MTIYDIAEEAGVSASTVSRVMNNKKGINEETRRRVWEILRKYDFQPSAFAQGLVNQTTRTIGILVSDIRIAHHAQGAYYIEQQMQKYEYSCIIINCGFTDASRDEALRIMAARRVEAVVMVGSTFQTERIMESIDRYIEGIPVIIENGELPLPHVYSVISDEENGIRDCVRLMNDRGHKNLCFVNVTETPSNQHKIDGFCAECRALFGEEKEPFICRIPTGDAAEDTEWEAAYQATMQLMKERPETDGIIFATDILAMGGMRAIKDMKKRIPDDVALIGVDNSFYSRTSSPALTTLDNNMKNLSIECSQLLIRIMNGETIPNRKILKTAVVERETT